MKRISTHMPNDDMQYHMRIRQWRLNEIQNKIAGQTRVKELRDDPLAASHSTKYQSYITRLERYSNNIDKIRGEYRVREGYLQSANQIVHRVRELAILGANSTYTTEDKQKMAAEINELLEELVAIGNARSGDGKSLFSGDSLQENPFRDLRGNVEGADGRVITSVLYTGGAARNEAEISEGNFVPATVTGSEVFWAEQQELISDVAADEYVVEDDSVIRIDDTEINLSAGDNVYSIMAKINNSAAAVKSSLDPVNNSLVLKTTYPHQLRLEDGVGGTVLQDLGVVTGLGQPPHNIDPDARVSGGSLFDMVISLRDKLYRGDTLDVGGAGLKGIEMAHGNLLTSLAALGARTERMDTVQSRISYELPEMTGRNSNEVDLDLSEAIMDMKVLEYTHQAALNTAGRILRPTLLDFLR